MSKAFREKVAALATEGWIVAERDRLDFKGRYLVAEPHEPGDLPSTDDATGPWFIIGDNLEALVDEAFAHLASINDAYATRH